MDTKTKAKTNTYTMAKTIVLFIAHREGAKLDNTKYMLTICHDTYT